MFPRAIESTIREIDGTRFGFLLLGPRQVGKSTLIGKAVDDKNIKQKLVFRLNETRTYFELQKNPSAIFDTVLAALENGPVLLFIDEVQRIPELLNDCQSLIDNYGDNITIYLTGSSARKLKGFGVNLLPGRVVLRYLHPLILPEMTQIQSEIFPIPIQSAKSSSFSPSLEKLLTFGSLPGIVNQSDTLKMEVLRSYTETYLQEEIRAEALSRNIGNFTRLLELVAVESGTIMNVRSLSNDSGIPASTISNYLQILEDTLVLFRLSPYVKNTKKRLMKSPKFIFFDTGVRNACAGFPLDEQVMMKTQAGVLFEQWVFLELRRRMEYMPNQGWSIYYWRTSTGVEVDLVLERNDRLIPIEVKYSTTPQRSDVRHLRSFMKDYTCDKGFLIGRFANIQKLDDGIFAVPWNRI